MTASGPRVTPYWLLAFSSRQSDLPSRSPAITSRYNVIMRLTAAGESSRNSMRKKRAPCFCRPRQVLGGRLRDRVVERVAAADVGLERVLLADAVAKLHVVNVAGPPAIGRVGSWRQEGTVDTVLHVKHGNLLMNHDFEPRRRRQFDQIVRAGRRSGRRTPSRGLLRGFSSRSTVSGLAALSEKSATNGMPCSAQYRHAACIAHQDPVGRLPGQEAEEVGFAGLFDPRGRQIDRGTRGWSPDRRHGLGVLLDVLVVGVDRRDAKLEGRFDLVGAATQNRQLDRGGLVARAAAARDPVRRRSARRSSRQDRSRGDGAGGGPAAASSSRATSSRRRRLSRLIGTIGPPSIVASSGRADRSCPPSARAASGTNSSVGGSRLGHGRATRADCTDAVSARRRRRVDPQRLARHGDDFRSSITLRLGGPSNDRRRRRVSSGSSVFQTCWPTSSSRRSIDSRPKRSSTRPVIWVALLSVSTCVASAPEG